MPGWRPIGGSVDPFTTLARYNRLQHVFDVFRNMSCTNIFQIHNSRARRRQLRNNTTKALGGLSKVNGPLIVAEDLGIFDMATFECCLFTKLNPTFERVRNDDCRSGRREEMILESTTLRRPKQSHFASAQRHAFCFHVKLSWLEGPQSTGWHGRGPKTSHRWTMLRAPCRISSLLTRL